MLIRLGGAHGNHADELHGHVRIVVEGVVLARGDEDGRTRRDGLRLALDGHAALALEHEHLMLPGVGMVGRLSARFDFDDPHRHFGLAVALAEQPADARALGRLLRFEFRFLVVHHLHGVASSYDLNPRPLPAGVSPTTRRIIPYSGPRVSKVNSDRGGQPRLRKEGLRLPSDDEGAIALTER